MASSQEGLMHRLMSTAISPFDQHIVGAYQNLALHERPCAHTRDVYSIGVLN